MSINIHGIETEQVEKSLHMLEKDSLTNTKPTHNNEDNDKEFDPANPEILIKVQQTFADYDKHLNKNSKATEDNDIKKQFDKEKKKKSEEEMENPEKNMGINGVIQKQEPLQQQQDPQQQL